MSAEEKKAGPSGQPTPKKGKKKALTIWGIVIAVIVVLVIGGLVWHEQPSFCGTLCHKPMYSYYDGWLNDTTLSSYAHAQAGTAEMVTAMEAYPDGVECLDCHHATLSQQIQEGIAFVTGDYEVPLPYVDDIGTYEMCTECHDYEKVTALTVDFGGDSGVNPHASHNGKLDCTSCHRMHNENIMWCNSCHNFELPEGWVNP